MQFQHLKRLCEMLVDTMEPSRPIFLVDDDDLVMRAPDMYPCIGFGVMYPHRDSLLADKNASLPTDPVNMETLWNLTEGDGVVVRLDLSGSVVPFGFLYDYVSRLPFEAITPVQDMDFKCHMVSQLGVWNPIHNGEPHMLYRQHWRTEMVNSWAGHMIELGLPLPPWTNLFAPDPEHEKSSGMSVCTG
jgi:hypothetical protein